MREPIHGRWLGTGDEAFAAMLEAIRQARSSVRLETYTFGADEVGARFRTALVEARRRGVSVRVLIDAWGSLLLDDDYWLPLQAAGGECRFFNRLHLGRVGFRDHRKLLVCDGAVAFVGGFNLAAEYAGDGVTRGWCDLGLRLEHPLVAQLADSFDHLFAHADVRHRRFARWRKPLLAPGTSFTLGRTAALAQLRVLAGLDAPPVALLLTGPGAGVNSFKRALRADLAHTRTVRIMTAYFLPTFRIRRELLRLARRGGRVQLIFAGRSDVPLAQRACQRLYTRLLNAGIEIYEYQPQMLHAKLVLLDQCLYIGSANLDVRSLNINYELMVRLRDEVLARQAADIFERTLTHCEPIRLEDWRARRTFVTRLLERWAYFILARLDPLFIRWQVRNLR